MGKRLILSVVAVLLTANLAAAQRKEYFTESEIDLIREAQEIPMRVKALFRLADLRLHALELKEKTAQEKEAERKADEQRRKEARDAQRAGKATPKAEERPEVYLADFTRAELLGGYTEALDEAMSDIDDAYSRKLDVRDALEQLAKYSKEQLPIVKSFQPKTTGETRAKDEAIEITQKAIDDSRAALEIVPKTEKSGKKP
jgi:hypothetical protein